MGEALDLHWSGIDFEGKRISIRRTLSKIAEGDVYGFMDEEKTWRCSKSCVCPRRFIEQSGEHILWERAVTADECLECNQPCV